jgi:hypothetical protein
MPRARHHAGTTLVEVLVVIVIFLVGILAVVQIFPKGFQILLLSRNASMATALSRDEVERLKSRPDQLPDAIVATFPDGTIDYGRSSADLGIAADRVAQDGTASLNGTNRGDWARFAGANAARHVIGESRRVPAPRQVGAPGVSNMYGGLFVCQFGPVDTLTGFGIQAYSNDLNLQLGDYNAENDRTEYDAFLLNPADPKLKLPRGEFDRWYRVSFSGYVRQDGGPFLRRDFIGLGARVFGEGGNGPYNLAEVDISDLLLEPVNNIGGRYNNMVVGSIDPSTVRVQRQYTERTETGWSENDVFEYRLLSPELGVLLFHPRAYSAFIPRASGKEALLARVDYDVFDWRVLREEFRFPYGLTAQHRLAVGSLKVGGESGFDGRNVQGIENLEGGSAPAGINGTGHSRANNFVLMDLDTGGIILETPFDEPNSTNPIITIDKTNGLISVRDTDGNPANGTTVHMRLPDGTIFTDVQIDNRALRALYRVKNEFAVQVMKSPSLFGLAGGRPSHGQYYVGGSSTDVGGAVTRIYFPRSDAGRKVTVGEINYRRAGDTMPRQMTSQDFVVSSGPDPVGLPFIDITTADPLAVTLDYQTLGFAARDVKAASITVRTIWNPEFFRFTGDAVGNVTERIDRWARGYRKSTNETYLEQGSMQR